jgi:excisionase family DNA binding protein
MIRCERFATSVGFEGGISIMDRSERVTIMDVAQLYLSRAEVARLFQVSPATVARWTREGKLPYTVTLGGRRRYPRGKILVLLQETERERETA